MRFRPGEALLLYIVVVVLLIGGSVFVRGLGGIALSEWLFVALPVVLATRAKTGEIARPLGLAAPRPLASVGAVLVGASLWLVLDVFVIPVQEHFFPTPKALDQSLQAIVSGPTWPTLLAVAVTPAICEELLCRGALARAFEVRGHAVGIVGSAALFALLHGDPHRFAPTFLLGLSLGWIALRTRSTITSMIVHVLNNAAIIIVSAIPAADRSLGRHVALYAGVALAASVAGHGLVLRSKVTDPTLLK